MTLKECYAKFNGDYEGALERLMNDDFMKRLNLKFIEDENMAKLLQSFEKGEVENTFHACHTLKGLALNLGYSELSQSSKELTELLRDRKDGDPMEDLQEIIGKLKSDYECIIEALKDVD